MTGFRGIAIPDRGNYWLRRARVPRCFLAQSGPDSPVDAEGVPLLDIFIRDGRIAAVTAAEESGSDAIDLNGYHLWPALIDMHVHLDKGQVLPRVVADGTFERARTETVQDRLRWNREDLECRMRFALRCAYVHGVSGIRTHLDSYPALAPTSWSLFQKLRAEWAGRISLQAVSLVPISTYTSDYGRELANLVAESGGILGGATNDIDHRDPAVAEATDIALDHMFRLARERALDIDLHTDQDAALGAFTLPRIARAVLRNGFRGRVVCSHCVNLVLQPEAVMRETIALCADARIAVATMPIPMVYLQDRADGRTPRWRGFTALHELRAGGVVVVIGGDNCRDAWYPYGDNDMVDTLQQAVRLLQLDRPLGDAPSLAAPIPADVMREPTLGRVAVGSPAHLILFNARTINHVMCRPQADRIVLSGGVRVTETLPDYDELGSGS